MLLLFDIGSPNPTTIVGLLVLIGASIVAFWKGLLPWLRAQWDAKEKALVKTQEDLTSALNEHKQQLLDEIAEARKERDEQRALRANELAAFLAELKSDRKMHQQGFAKIARMVSSALKEKK